MKHGHLQNLHAQKSLRERQEKTATNSKRRRNSRLGSLQTPIIAPMYHNKTPRGWRPNVDPVVMVKLLVHQSWNGLSDPELERRAADRISFQRFLGFHEKAPDYSKVWQFRERLAESGRGEEARMQRQLGEEG